MASSNKEKRRSFSGRAGLQLTLVAVATFMVLIILSFAIPINVMGLLIFSITVTFFAVYLFVWCFTVLEEKRIMDESKREFEESQKSLENPHPTYNSTGNVESSKSNP